MTHTSSISVDKDKNESDKRNKATEQTNDPTTNRQRLDNDDGGWVSDCLFNC